MNMESFDTNSSRIVIRPSAVYWIISLLFFAGGFLMYWGLGQALPSDNPRTDKILRLLSLIIPVTTGLLFVLYAATKRITVDENGITSGIFLSRRKLYTWNEITSAYIIREAVAYPCKVYAREKLIAKVPRAFVGYESLLEELDKRDMLREDDWYEAAKGMLALDKVKLRDFFRKDTDEE